MTSTLIVLLFAVTLSAILVVWALSDVLERTDRRRLNALLAVVVVVYACALWFRPASLTASNIAVLGLAVTAATVLGRSFQTNGAVIAFSVAASIADIISFTVGPTRSLLEHADRTAGSLISYLALSISRGQIIVPVVGLGDLLVLGVYFIALKHVGISAAQRFTIPAAGLLAALAVGLLAGGAFGIPFMALAVVALLLQADRRAPRIASAEC